MADPIISVKNLRIVYDPGETSEVVAVDDASLDIFPEEYIIFFGPSGCGKSTLLYTIAGLEVPSSGTVRVQSRDLASMAEDDVVHYHRTSIGMVFQAYYLIPSLSVLGNVVLPEIFLSLLPEKRVSRARELLARFGIDDQRDRYPTALSGGQQQRVAIARSLVNNPPIILADEPVGNLDSKSADGVLELLRELNEKDKKTVILVTHNPSHLKHAHRIFYMRDGKIVREVRNTEREQVREQELKPFVSYGLREYAQLYPNLSEEELKAKMFANYVLREPDLRTQYQFEILIRRFMLGEINHEEFFRLITMPIRDGGIGMYAPHAERLITEFSDLLKLSVYLAERFKTFPKSYDEYDRVIDQILRFLLIGQESHVNDKQRIFIKRAIKARLEGSLDKRRFQEILDRPLSDDGGGLNVRTARNMTLQLEILLAGITDTSRSRPDIPASLLPISIPSPLAQQTKEKTSPPVPISLLPVVIAEREAKKKALTQSPTHAHH